MTNKEKLEIIDKQLNLWYKILEQETLDYKANVISQSIYNLESTKLLLEPIEKEEHYEIYECPECHREQHIYGEFISGKCLYCNKDFVKKDMQ